MRNQNTRIYSLEPTMLYLIALCECHLIRMRTAHTGTNRLDERLTGTYNIRSNKERFISSSGFSNPLFFWDERFTNIFFRVLYYLLRRFYL